tara:strand:+ start:557 stop:1084 length:528 start_codon:yes stop_codon:yes gene_type:complete
MNQFDDTSFDAPIPGMGMTHELGARPWQTPPTYTTVEETSDYYIEKMSNPKFKEQLLDVMEMKIPLTTLANTIQLGSVMEGLHTVDVGILMIPILVETMALIGDSSDVDYVTGMDDVKADRPAMTSRIISDLQDKQNLDSDVSMEEPMAEDMPIEEPLDKEMPMEEPKGLMARRV